MKTSSEVTNETKPCRVATSAETALTNTEVFVSFQTMPPSPLFSQIYLLRLNLKISYDTRCYRRASGALVVALQLLKIIYLTQIYHFSVVSL